MNTFDWIVIGFSFVACIFIGRMNVLLIKSRGVSVFSILVALATLFGGILLLQNENIKPLEEIIVSAIIGITYFSIFVFLYLRVCKEDEERDKRNKRYVR